MNRNELIAGLLKGEYDAVLSRDVALKPAIGPNVFDKYNVIPALISNPRLFIGFHIVDDLDSISIIASNEDLDIIKISFKNDLIVKLVFRTPDPAFKRIRLLIAYDGTEFSGFQRQSELRSVQSELEIAVSTINGIRTTINGASRTDSGVHAYGQVVHFDTPLDITDDKWKLILNNLLPEDVRILEVKAVSQLFHSRYDVAFKEYRYVLNLGEYSPFTRKYEWTLPHPLDLDLFAKELKKFEGTHDFTSFCKGEKATKVRTIYETKMELKDNRLYITFIGNGFLHNMIRIMMSLLVNIATGKLDCDVTQVIQEKNRVHTNHMAPASGLYLVRIQY